MDHYKTKEDVLKMGIIDPELEEVGDIAIFFFTYTDVRYYRFSNIHPLPTLTFRFQLSS